MAKGASFMTAQQRAYAAIDGIVSQQMLLKSFIDVFIFVTIFFVLCIPLILTVRKGKTSTAGVALDAH